MTALADADAAPATPQTVTRPTTLMLTVTSIINSANGIRTITLAYPDGSALPGFVPGSHLVVAAGTHSNACSLVSDGANPTEYTISVLRVEEGNGGSRWLHDELAEGDQLEVRPPRSAFAPAARAASAAGFSDRLRMIRSWAATVSVSSQPSRMAEPSRPQPTRTTGPGTDAALGIRRCRRSRTGRRRSPPAASCSRAP